jgi:hypothetical protein
MKKILLMGLMFLSFSSSAEWIAVNTDSGKDNYFYDPISIGIYGSTRKVWLLINLAKPIDSADGKALSLNVYYKFDCENSRYANITTFFFNDKGGMGKVLERLSDADEKWKDIAPQDALEKTRQAVCKR